MRLPDTDFARRLAGRSGILELMDDLGACNQGIDDSIMLGGGNPAHVPAVEAVWRRRWAELAAEEGRLESLLGDYAPPRGHPDFVAAVCDFFRRHHGWAIGPENVVVTAGSQTGFFLLFNLLAGGDGDRTSRILFPLVPEYIGYADQLLVPDALAAAPARVETIGAHDFKYRVDFANLTVDDDVAALCCSRPTNPSANLVTAGEVERLRALARAHDAVLIVDNAYGQPFPGAVFAPEPVPDWGEDLVMSFSLSKLGLPTTRTGIVIAPEAIAARLAAAIAVVGLANGSLGQAITTPLFASDEVVAMSETIRGYYRNRCRWVRACVADEFPDDLPYRVHLAEGAFFLWFWFPGLPIDDRELYRRLKARGVIVVPGSYFFPGLSEPWPHRRECLRISYCRPEDEVRAGIRIIAEELARAYA